MVPERLRWQASRRNYRMDLLHVVNPYPANVDNMASSYQC
jgi:hypothetical protein